MVIYIQEKDLDKVLKSKKVLLDVYADWCGTCRMIAPIIDKVSEKHKDFQVAKLNADEISEELKTKYSLTSLPTLFFFKEGKLVATHVGYATEEALDSKMAEL